MKKLLTIMAAAATASLFADFGYQNGTGFEDATADAAVTGYQEYGGGAWSGSADATVKAYAQGEAVGTGTYITDVSSTDAFKFRTSGDNNNYLQVETGADAVQRALSQSSLDLTDNDVLIDTMVQFTASDEPTMTPENDDKLLVWLYKAEDSEDAQLMITAGKADAEYTIQATNYTVENVTVTEGAWYQLTVRATTITDTLYEKPMAAFEVSIGGVVCTATDGTSLFPSLVNGNMDGAKTLTTVGFKGTGKVDDLVVSTAAPVVPAKPFIVTIGENDPVECDSLAAVATALDGASAATIVLNANYNIVAGGFEVGETANITFDLNGKTLTSAADDASIFYVDGTFTLKDSVGGGLVAYTVVPDDVYIVENYGTTVIGENPTGVLFTLDGGILNSEGTLTINGGKFAEEPEGEYNVPAGYELTEGEDTYLTLQKIGGDEPTEGVDVDDVASETYESQAAAETAAATIKINAPALADLSAEQQAAYADYVDTVVTPNGDGTYSLTPVIAEDAEAELEEDLDVAAADILELSESGTVEVTVVPGLYYTLESGSTLALENEPDEQLATREDDTLEFTISKDGDKGFYRIKVSPTSAK